MSVYDKIFPPRVLTLPNGKQVSKPRSRAPLAAVILVAMTPFRWRSPALTWRFWSAGSKNFLSFWGT